jgi:hypothetical protein
MRRRISGPLLEAAIFPRSPEKEDRSMLLMIPYAWLRQFWRDAERLCACFESTPISTI